MCGEKNHKAGFRVRKQIMFWGCVVLFLFFLTLSKWPFIKINIVAALKKVKDIKVNAQVHKIAYMCKCV